MNMVVSYRVLVGYWRGAASSVLIDIVSGACHDGLSHSLWAV